MDDVFQWILEHVDQTYRKGNWAGRGVLPAIEGVDAGAAHWRPHPERHTIAGIALHMGHWKDAAGTRMAGRPWADDEQQDGRGVPAAGQGGSQARPAVEQPNQR